MLLPVYNLFFCPNQVKAWVYLFLAAAESEETQRRGIVCIVNMMGVLQTATSTESREHFYEYASTLHWLPIRHVGYHFNMFQDHNEALEQLLAIAIFYSPKENRSRIRIHIGTCYHYFLSFSLCYNLDFLFSCYFDFETILTFIKTPNMHKKQVRLWNVNIK